MLSLPDLKGITSHITHRTEKYLYMTLRRNLDKTLDEKGTNKVRVFKSKSGCRCQDVISELEHRRYAAQLRQARLTSTNAQGHIGQKTGNTLPRN